ncbi:MAG: hypothetical protein MUC40_07120 [Akkermansiaceae bacterium]|jgi:hypothetical protein|nr:hypothetical protein [Akkermansiaceae bacterium]
MSEEVRKWPRPVAWLLVLLPLWLFASGAGAVWYFLHAEKRQELRGEQRFARAVSREMMADDLRKLVELIGERHASSETAARNLSRAAAMIEGLLGPGNTGYKVRRGRGPGEWPLLHVTLAGDQPAAPAVWVVSSYDSRPGSPGAEANATGLAATLAAAQALAGASFPASIHFVLIPHANDRDSPVLETAARLRDLIRDSGEPRALLHVEAMGAGRQLWLSSRDTAAAPLALAHELGVVRGMEDVCLSDDADTASVLFEMGLPAVRVATRAQVAPDEADSALPDAALVAASTGRLIELIRRCAARP